MGELVFEKMADIVPKRFEKFILEFKAEFGSAAPEFIIRVPGRVNLIGEHIDYCGYAVHPMAIEQDILVAVVHSGDSGLEIRNTDPTYPTYKCSSLDNIEISTEKIFWWSYFLCGLKGVFEELKVQPAGMKLLVSGRVPPSAGLSSSSALVVSAAITAISVNSLVVERSDLAALCARAERYIGTQGGGMDQAIEILAKEGQAKLIEFNPLAAHDVQLPQGAVFVVANSLQEKNKAASNEFNSRVVECRLASKLLAKKLIQGEAWKTLTKLRDVQMGCKVELQDMANKVEEILHKQVYTREEILKELEISDETLRSDILTPNTADLQQFKLNQRARHVFSEAARVYQFRQTCQAAGDGCLEELGNLMTASHTSCRDDYECSAPELDRLVATSIKLGAYGCRLTGAGWGGCTVSLVASDKVEEFMNQLRLEFYGGLADLDTMAFVTKPSQGAQVFKL